MAGFLSAGIQVIHDNISTELGVVTANSSEMQRRYLSQPSIQAQLDNLVLMRLQEQINPPINEQLLSEKLIEEFNPDFKELCSVSYRSLEEVVEWFFKVLDTETIPSLDGLKKLKRTINLIYRTQGRTEDLQDWLKLLLDRFEAYMKKMYYMANHIELTREDRGFVQFLDAAKALNVNRLYYTEESKLANFKTYYEFVHAQRNAESHTAPVIEDAHVPIGIHMAMAMYLYATMINVTVMEIAGNDMNSSPSTIISPKNEKRYEIHNFENLSENPNYEYEIAAEAINVINFPEQTRIEILRRSLVNLINYGYTKKNSVFTKRRHWESIYRIAVDYGFVIDGDYAYFKRIIDGMQLDNLPTTLTRDLIEKANKGIYAQDFKDWTSDGLIGDKLKEYEDVKHCAEVFNNIVTKTIHKQKGNQI